jgi:hypothetical protein
MWLELILTGLLIVEVLNCGMRLIKLAYIIDEEKVEEMDPQVQRYMYS